jgi:hypothetical protein
LKNMHHDPLSKRTRATRRPAQVGSHVNLWGRRDEKLSLANHRAGL